MSPCSSRSRSRNEAARSKFWSRTAASFSTLTPSSCALSSVTCGGGACVASRARAPASSITSMALSGRKRSVTREDLDRLVDRRRLYDHGLETALEGTVLLDVFAVLIERGRADALKLS